MIDEEGKERRTFTFGRPLRIRIELEAFERIDDPLINFAIRRPDGVVVCNFNNWYDNFRLDHLQGLCSLEGWLPPLRLIPNFYEALVLVWPWGGGHFEGEMSRSVPLASRNFGEFAIEGPALNSHDGIFQIPAKKWTFTRGEDVTQTTDIDKDALKKAFKTQQSIN